ncbi:hypothetical protein [Phytohabitans rumicis]|uniref:Uncharacterized protein n=1 Tax=Phytohabitans rumicis TaxID=1076125 RepID=A0A6V8KWT1_9ACTN|nr:hypothetical protein [Phytohabitans rumicis]GFJ87840.1 hypothetical protein Prum_014820 [Phytohabitans rumicis]
MEELSLRGQPRARIEIDLNSRGRDGYVRARLRKADRPVVAGDEVTVFEPDDQVAAVATVVRVDEERGFLSLDVDWSTLVDDYHVILLSAPNAAKNSLTVDPLVFVYPRRVQSRFQQ